MTEEDKVMPRDAEKENEIVNRHMGRMMTELQEKGFEPEAMLAFVVFTGKEGKKVDYNLATMIDPLKVPIPFDQARTALIEFAHDELCMMIDASDDDDDDETPPPEGERH